MNTPWFNWFFSEFRALNHEGIAQAVYSGFCLGYLEGETEELVRGLLLKSPQVLQGVYMNDRTFYHAFSWLYLHTPLFEGKSVRRPSTFKEAVDTYMEESLDAWEYQNPLEGGELLRAMLFLSDVSHALTPKDVLIRNWWQALQDGGRPCGSDLIHKPVDALHGAVYCHLLMDFFDPFIAKSPCGHRPDIYRRWGTQEFRGYMLSRWRLIDKSPVLNAKSPEEAYAALGTLYDLSKANERLRWIH
jgi:hypothetical protein